MSQKYLDIWRQKFTGRFWRENSNIFWFLFEIVKEKSKKKIVTLNFEAKNQISVLAQKFISYEGIKYSSLVLISRFQPFLDIFKRYWNGLRRNVDIKINSNRFAHFHHAFSVCSICQNQNLKNNFLSAVCLHFCIKFSRLFTNSSCLFTFCKLQLFVYFFLLGVAIYLDFKQKCQLFVYFWQSSAVYLLSY